MKKRVQNDTLLAMSSFSARVIRGAGRGKPLGSPTLNLDLGAIPPDIKDGIFAGMVTIDDTKYPAAIHYGERMFHDGQRTFEAHLIDISLEETPETVSVELVKRLRDVRNFPSEDALKEQIAMDITQARDILAQQ